MLDVPLIEYQMFQCKMLKVSPGSDFYVSTFFNPPGPGLILWNEPSPVLEARTRDCRLVLCRHREPVMMSDCPGDFSLSATKQKRLARAHPGATGSSHADRRCERRGVANWKPCAPSGCGILSGGEPGVEHDRTYEDMAHKFAEHFYYIAAAMNMNNSTSPHKAYLLSSTIHFCLGNKHSPSRCLDIRRQSIDSRSGSRKGTGYSSTSPGRD